ncbi:MAG: hypothetical protein R3C45_05420 [Phycisphaerales bacterium]
MATRIQMALMMAVFCLQLTSGVSASAEEGMHHPPAPATNADFERLKSLAGAWEGTVTHLGGEAEPASINFAVTAGGSALVETEFPGTEHEMVTVFYMQGDQLALTHYCMLGNQPTMAAQPDNDPDTLSFDFTGGTNIETGNEFHMRKLEYTFIDPDHITATWTSYVQGEPSACAVIDLKRKTE